MSCKTYLARFINKLRAL